MLRFSPRTVEAYSRWIKGHVRYHKLRHPRELAAGHVRDYLEYLARERQVAASTQNQAFAALHFLYREVLVAPLTELARVAPGKLPHRLPNVLSCENAQRVLNEMDGTPKLMAQLLYGSGLRLQECCTLRVKDLNLDRGELRVRMGKGMRDRVSMILVSLHDAIRAQVRVVKRVRDTRAARRRRRSSVAATPFAIRLQRTYWRQATTFAPCRSCMGTQTCQRQCCTHTFSIAAARL